MLKQLTFYFDLGSPWSYLASARLPALTSVTGVKPTWMPLLLGGVFKATGNRAPIEVPSKARYMLHDLGRCARHYKIPFHMNDAFPVNTLLLMRLVVAARLHQPQHFAALCSGLFRALWVDNRPMANADVVRTVLLTLPVDAEGLLDAAQSQPVKDALRQETEAAVARGVFGAPTFIVHDGRGHEEMFFGHDRLELLQAALMA